MSNNTNFQKIREFHNASNLDNHYEHQYNVFDNEKLIKLRLGLIEEEFNELKTAIKEKNFTEVRDAIADILYVVYGTAASFGIDADNDYDKVHKSNMTKFCDSEKIAEKTVENYKNLYKTGESPYDSPTYRTSIDGKYFIVYNKSTGKILKSCKYQPVQFNFLEKSCDKTNFLEKSCDKKLT